MAVQRLERPRFFEGQFIGAADLEIIITYARELARELALGGQSWGIAIGLDLVEVEAPGGEIQYFVLPGIAWDGYGRPVVVLSPAEVRAEKFAGLPDGNHKVWLRYDETAHQGLRPGWETCGNVDVFSRVRESFAIEAGPFSLVRERQSGVIVNGALVEDARLSLHQIDEDAGLVCDGSIPHQAFPEDKARWLIPIGWAAWKSGAPGHFEARAEVAKRGGRRFRRYVGTVAESLFAADGVIRLRDRMTQFKAGDNPDDLCEAGAIQDADLVQQPDKNDSSKTIDRLVGRELVWVEGHMRATGDVRLFGTRLELRDAKGEEKGGSPLYLKRASADNADGGQDLQIAVGASADGKDRLVVGVAAPGDPLAVKLQLKNDGRLAVGSAIPADVKSHTILAATDADTSVAIAVGAKKTATLQIATTPTLGPVAHLAFDDDKKKLRLGVGTDLAQFMYVNAEGRVGLKTDAPEAVDAEANDLVIKSPTNTGITLLCDPGQTCRIHFADGVATPDERHAGRIVYDHNVDRLEFGTKADTRVVIDQQGNVGMGTLAPAERLQIQSLTDARAMKIGADRLQAENGGAASQMQIQPNGAGVLVGGALVADRQIFLHPDGRIGVGTQTPGDSLHVFKSSPSLGLDRSPGGGSPAVHFMDNGAVRSAIHWDAADTRTYMSNKGAVALTVDSEKLGVGIGAMAPTAALHVRGNVAQDASQLSSHVAVIENMAGGNADVLALRVAGAAVDASNNFITFFDNTGMVGSIEKSNVQTSDDPSDAGTFMRLQSGAGDFAESLPRADVEAIGPGRIVGIRNGRVSLRTEDADSLLVTTDRAIVVGNAPLRGDAKSRETVALVGQVPVWVDGPVEAGDFIVPSSRHDGIGRAVAPNAMTTSNATRIVGRAWQSSKANEPRRINVAVGVAGTAATDALAVALAKQAETIRQLSQEVAALRAKLDS